MNESDSDEGSQPGRHQEQSSPSPINANGSRLSVLASQQNSRTSSSNSLSPNRRVSPREFDRLDQLILLIESRETYVSPFLIVDLSGFRTQRVNYHEVQLMRSFGWI